MSHARHSVAVTLYRITVIEFNLVYERKVVYVYLLSQIPTNNARYNHVCAPAGTCNKDILGSWLYRLP